MTARLVVRDSEGRQVGTAFPAEGGGLVLRVHLDAHHCAWRVERRQQEAAGARRQASTHARQALRLLRRDTLTPAQRVQAMDVLLEAAEAWGYARGVEAVDGTEPADVSALDEARRLLMDAAREVAT